MQKKCSKCGVVKSIECFSNRKASPDGRHPTCRACVSIMDSKLSNKNLECNLAYLREHYPDALKCQICGEDKFHRLEYHHIIPLSDGAYPRIGNLLYKSPGLVKKRIEKQLKLCACLCANHHKDIHYELRNNRVLVLKPIIG